MRDYIVYTHIYNLKKGEDVKKNTVSARNYKSAENKALKYWLSEGFIAFKAEAELA